MFYFNNMEELTISLNKILYNIDNIKLNLTSLKKDVKDLEKKTKKKIKNLNKKKKVINKSEKKPSGFAKPTKLSKELISFMNLEDGVEMARTDVTKYIINYIKENELENKENRKLIKPDNNLKNLLGINNEEIGYFDIQKYMNKHYLK